MIAPADMIAHLARPDNIVTQFRRMARRMHRVATTLPRVGSLDFISTGAGDIAEGRWSTSQLVRGRNVVSGYFPLGLQAWDKDVRGSTNSVNKIFYIGKPSDGYVSGTLQVVKNGLWMLGSGNDFTEGTTTQVLFFTPPITNDVLSASYIRKTDLVEVADVALTGTINGVNQTFTLPEEYQGGSLIVKRNNQTLDFGGDYVEGPRGFSFLTAPAQGDAIIAGFQVESDDTWIYQETPSGAIDGSNKVYTVVNAYSTGFMFPVLNGRMRTLTTDFTETTSTSFTMNTAPATPDRLWCIYRKA